MAAGVTKPLNCQVSNKTTTSQNAHLIAEPIKSTQDPVNQ